MAENWTGGGHVAKNEATAIGLRRFESTVFRVLLSKEKKMKKLASILGIGAISVAVALAPAFAQQTKPEEPAGTATVQPKSDVKIPANVTAKDEKTLPAKPGSASKPGAGTKTTAPSNSVKPMSDVKTDKDKSTPAKTGSDVKNEAVSGKAAPDVKAGTVPAKTGTGVKNQKGSNVKPGANLKSVRHAKSKVHSKAAATHKHHVKNSSQKPA